MPRLFDKETGVSIVYPAGDKPPYDRFNDLVKKKKSLKSANEVKSDKTGQVDRITKVESDEKKKTFKRIGFEGIK